MESGIEYNRDVEYHPCWIKTVRMVFLYLVLPDTLILWKPVLGRKVFIQSL